ncbi:aspartic peptidase [Tanacetum coccineum]
MIRNTPLILNKWTPNFSLAKDEVTKVPVWVKLHRVPVVAYSEDGLSLIASQGRIGFARALIEVSAEKDLKENVIMAVPLENGEGCTMVANTVEENNDGFVQVNNRKSKGKGHVNSQKKHAMGFKVGNNQNLQYQPVKSKSSGSKSNNNHQVNGIKLKNLFEKLNDITIPDYTIRGIKSQGVVEARIMGNSEFIDTFPGAYGVFQPYCISDHSPAWNVNIEGIKLDEVLKAFDKDLLDSNLRDEEATYIRAFIDAKLDEEHFLKQKAKIEWLEVGDSNSAFFHKSVKSRNQRSRIDTIRDAADCEVTGSLVAECFVNHYQQFLGTNMECVDLDSDGLFLNRVSVATSLKMVRNVSNEEVKIAMFSIGDDSAPDPDGFTSAFFKKSWDLVGNNICSAVKEFFNKGKLLKEINHTFLALILIVATPLKDCKVLVKKVSNRIGDWKNESLSYAGRHQLCRSVLSSMHVYWAAVLVIPIGIIQDIEQLMRCFLWCNGELKRGSKLLDMHVDLLQWRDSKGVMTMISVRGAWEALHLRGNELNRRNARSVIGRILVAAAAYFIWVERNNHVFKNSRRSPEELCDAIIVTVRLKLLSFRFKNTAAFQDILARWKMPSSFRLYS